MDKEYFKKPLLIIFVVLYVLTSQAKVAYLPMITPKFINVFPPETVLVRDTIMVLDLESFTVLKEINFGIDDFYGSVFLNHSDTKLYVAGLNHIYTIDTTTLEIEETLEVPVETPLSGESAYIAEIFLNAKGDKLYYTGNFSGLLHQVDLTTKEVTIALDFGDYIIDEIDYNESLNTVFFINFNYINSDTNFHVFDLNGLIEKAEHEVFTSDVKLISNDGLDYFYHSRLTGGINALYSRNATENTLNWSFELEDSPLFVYVFENSDNTISVIGRDYTYRINRTTGEGFIESDYNIDNIQPSSSGALKKIDDNSIFSARSVRITCAEPTEITSEASRKFCIYNTGAHAYTNKIVERTNHLIFESNIYTGTDVEGRFIGERKYFPAVNIPVMSTQISVLLLIILIILFAFYRQYNEKYKRSI